MVYGLKTSASKVVHTAECHYIARHTEKEMIAYENIVGAIQAGRRFCRHCNPVLREFDQNRTAFDRFCAENGYRYRVGRMSIDLQTPISAWKLAVGEENRPALFHRNTEWRSTDDRSPIDGYHLQRCPARDLLSQLEYICGHDCFRSEHPYYPSKPKKKPTTKPAPSKEKTPAADKEGFPTPMRKKNRKKKEKQQREQERRAKIRGVLDTIDALQMARRATA